MIYFGSCPGIWENWLSWSNHWKWQSFCSTIVPKRMFLNWHHILFPPWIEISVLTQLNWSKKYQVLLVRELHWLHACSLALWIVHMASVIVMNRGRYDHRYHTSRSWKVRFRQNRERFSWFAAWCWKLIRISRETVWSFID